MRIRTQSRENAADVGTLKGIGYLNSEESEAYVPHLPEGKFRFLHFYAVFGYYFSVLDNHAKIKINFYTLLY
jgi:hypothetical protein